MINPRTKSMIFVNNTDLPIIICSWMEKIPGLSEYKDKTILANTRETVYSDVGEWIISSQFWNKEQNDEWQSEGLEQDCRIAKFRNTPCAIGNYTWNYIEESFVLEHNDGVITWSRKPETIK